VLERHEIGKAFAYSTDEIVEISASDLQSISAVDDKKIVLVQFISATSLDLTLLAGRSLQLAPSHAAAGPLYATIVAALTKTTKWGVGTASFRANGT
jgi:non-homologous end joining protein Ku